MLDHCGVCLRVFVGSVIGHFLFESLLQLISFIFFVCVVQDLKVSTRL